MRPWLVPLAVAAASLPAGAQTRLPHVQVRTALGDIELEIDSVRAPGTAANFLAYVDAGFYSNARFHRSVRLDNQPNNAIKIEVIQAGADSATRARHGRPAIPLERTSLTGLRHSDGAVSMARGGPDSATSDFFICIGDQPELDFGGRRNADGQGFAAFGRVVRGADVVRRVQRQPVEAQRLTPPVPIRDITRLP